MKIIFIRHGESQANRDGVIAGSGLDSPLTKKGISDAKITADNLKKLDQKIDHVVSSPLIRALDTAKIILSELDIAKDIEIIPEFSERNAGSITGNKTSNKAFTIMDAADTNSDIETLTEMSTRLQKGIEALKKRNGTILVVSHNGAIKVARTILAGLPPEKFTEMPNLPNGEIFIWQD